MNINAIFSFLAAHVIETIFAVTIPTLITFLRVVKPRLLFRATLVFIETVFKIQLSEIFYISEVAILKRIRTDTHANRVALIRFKHNGTTEIDVLSEVKTVDRNLREISSFSADQYRGMVDDLTITKRAVVFDGTRERHIEFFNLIATSFNCNSFVLIPIYQNDTAHEAIVILAAFDEYKLFDAKLLNSIRINAHKVAKLSYLIR